MTTDRWFAKDGQLTFPQMKALGSHGRPDDKTVGFEERIGEFTQCTGPVDPGPQRHCFLLELQPTSNRERKLPLK